MNVVNMLATALHMTPFARGLGGGGEGGEREFPPGLSSVLNHYNSVCPVYISKVTGVNPLTGLISVRQEGAYAPAPPLLYSLTKNPSLPRRPRLSGYCPDIDNVKVLVYL